MYTVSCQSQWPSGDLMVEVSQGGIDYTNPDALVVPYEGNLVEYADPREAAKVALRIRDQWQKDRPGEYIAVGQGGTGGMTMPFEESHAEDLTRWAEEEYETLPKCDRCGELIEGEPYSYCWSDDFKFCSEVCAERAWEEAVQEATHSENEGGEES